MFYVYQLKVEGESLPFYVGKGHDSRAFEHTRKSSLSFDTNTHKVNIIRKAQRENNKIIVEFLKEGLCEEDSFMWEVFWIAEYGRYDLGLGPLTNKTDGGDGISGLIITDEHKQKISLANSGENNPMFGKKHSEESNLLRAESWKKNNVGHKHSVETKQKLADAKRGTKESDETRRRKSEAQKRRHRNKVS